MLALFLRKVLTIFGEEQLKTVRNTAEATLYVNMQNDLDRLRTEIGAIRETYQREIADMKAEHIREREELLTRVRQLENALQSIKHFNETIKIDAMNVLAKIEVDAEAETGISAEIKGLLNKIIEEVDKRQHKKKS